MTYSISICTKLNVDKKFLCVEGNTLHGTLRQIEMSIKSFYLLFFLVSESETEMYRSCFHNTIIPSLLIQSYLSLLLKTCASHYVFAMN